MRKPRLGTVKHLVQRHRASKWQIWNWNPAALRSSPVPFPKHMLLAQIVNCVTLFYALSTSVVNTTHHIRRGDKSFLCYSLIPELARMN